MKSMKIMKGSTDQPLRFGTSGLRDFDENLTDREVYINTKGFLMYLHELGGQGAAGGIKAGASLTLAADYRPSSRIDRIPRAVAVAVLDAGCEVLFCGQIPTPAVAYYGLSHGLASIMITGSHIPFGLNGIKFNRPNGEILKSEEKPILEQVARVRQEVADGPRKEWFGPEGGFNPAQSPSLAVLLHKADVALAKKEARAECDYIERYVSVFGPEALRGVDLVFYRQSTVGRDLLPAILRGLGAKVTEVGELQVEHGAFLPVDTEKMTPEIRRVLQQLAVDFEAAHGHKPFAVLSADGDADRPVFCDENGEFIPGDMLGVLTSLFLKPNFVAVPITCNSAAVRWLQRFATVVQTRVGSPYINQAMQTALMNNPFLRAAGYEANGGYLLGTDWEIGGRTLKALPTRDAVLPMICGLLLARQGSIEKEDGSIAPVSRVSDLVSEFPRHVFAGVVDREHDGVAYESAETGKRILRRLSPVEAGIEEVDFRQETIVYTHESGSVIRSSRNDTGNIGGLPAECQTIQRRLAGYFHPARGFAPIEKLNYQDGLRIYFSNGEVVHLRPSGNAPEFRFYAEADQAARARQIGERRVEIAREMIRDLASE
jgi:phosphomannomutase